MDLIPCFNKRLSRSQALRNFNILSGASLTLDAGLVSTSKVAAEHYVSKTNPIKHILIACQENHSFDNYFGYYPRVGVFGVPSNYTQPDGKGGTVTPHHAFFPITADPSHTWQSIHRERNHGAMDGF